jgi:hypothetical protein
MRVKYPGNEEITSEALPSSDGQEHRAEVEPDLIEAAPDEIVEIEYPKEHDKPLPN